MHSNALVVIRISPLSLIQIHNYTHQPRHSGLDLEVKNLLKDTTKEKNYKGEKSTKQSRVCNSCKSLLWKKKVFLKNKMFQTTTGCRVGTKTKPCLSAAQLRKHFVQAVIKTEHRHRIKEEHKHPLVLTQKNA